MNRRVRVLNSLLWMTLTVVKPLRLIIQGLGIFVWPSVSPFSDLAKLHPSYVPLTLFVLVGYCITCVILLWLIRTYPTFADIVQEPEKSPTLRAVAIGVTSMWLALALAAGKLDYPLVLGALLIYSAFLEIRTSPKPQPEPPPLPPEPQPGPEEDSEDREEGDCLIRKYEWLFNEEPFRKSGPTKQFSFSLRIPKSVYEDCRQRDHTLHSDADYVKFAKAQVDDATVVSLAHKLKEISQQNTYDELSELHLAMAFTLSMPYAYDDQEYGVEYPKFPVEMLVDKRGDCKDFSILCSTLFFKMGYRSALILMRFTDKSVGHAAVGVVPPVAIPYGGFTLYSSELNEEWIYCEVTPTLDATTKQTTDVQWWLGMMVWTTAYDFKVYPIGS